MSLLRLREWPQYVDRNTFEWVLRREELEMVGPLSKQDPVLDASSAVPYGSEHVGSHVRPIIRASNGVIQSSLPRMTSKQRMMRKVQDPWSKRLGQHDLNLTIVWTFSS